MSLYHGDKKVAEGRIKTQPGLFSIAGEGLCVGRSSGEPVTADYPGDYPHAFTGGTIKRVAVDVSGEPYIDLEREAAAMLGRSGEMAAVLTITQLFDSGLAIRIDGKRALGTAASVRWHFTDTGETYRMELSNGALITTRPPGQTLPTWSSRSPARSCSPCSAARAPKDHIINSGFPRPSPPSPHSPTSPTPPSRSSRPEPCIGARARCGAGYRRNASAPSEQVMDLRLPVRRDTLRKDAVAGLVLGVESIPDGLAAGLLAGVNPLSGLYAYMFGTLGGSLSTSSAFMAVQATGAMAIIIADVPAVHSGADQAGALFTLAVLTGVVMMAAGFLRLGSLLRFVSNAVMVGIHQCCWRQYRAGPAGQPHRLQSRGR